MEPLHPVIRAVALLVAAGCAAALGACSPERRVAPSAESGGQRTSAASVQSGTAPVGSRARTRRSGEVRPPGSPELVVDGDETDATSVPSAPAASGRPVGAAGSEGDSREESGPVGPQAAGSRAHRERIVEEASAEDRPEGRREARFEADGVDYRPGVGFLPHYRLRAVERTGPSAPDPALEKALPGLRLDLPPPEKPKPVVVEKAAEQTESEPRVVAPRPAN